MSELQAVNLFSVKGTVAVITGGATGIASSSTIEKCSITN